MADPQTDSVQPVNLQTAPGQATAQPTWQQSIQQVSQMLSYTSDFMVVIPPNPSLDAVCAGVALSLSLRKIGKLALLVTTDKPKVADIFGNLDQNDVPEPLIEATNSISDDMFRKQLYLTIDFKSGSFDQGKFEDSKDSLLLRLMPKQGEDPIVPINISTQTYEVSPKLIFSVGLENLFVINQLYSANKSFFDETPIVTIDDHPNNTKYGRVNLLDTKASSLCEMITLTLYDLRFVFDRDVAKILYLGMKQKTNNFDKSNFTPNLLEAMSISLRYQQPPKQK